MPTKFKFFSRSIDAAPGKGAGEEMSGNPVRFDALEKEPNWRRTLSNFAHAPFVWKGLTWNTVEHAFQAAKFEDRDFDVFFNFSETSQSELGLGDGKAARDNRKVVRLTNAEIDAWDKKSQSVMQQLWRHKFYHDADARRVLLKTRDAQLWHIRPRQESVRWTGLEDLRDELREKEVYNGGMQ